MTRTTLAAEEPEPQRFATASAADVLDFAAEIGVSVTPWQAWVLRASFGEREPYRTTAWVDKPKAIETKE